MSIDLQISKAPDTKRCSRCGEYKPRAAYSKRTASKDGLQNECTACHAVRYRTNPAYKQRHRENTRLRQRALRSHVNHLKSIQGCECGERHPAALDYHHLDPKDKSLSVSRMVSDGRPVEDILNEIAKCVLLCANCHRKLHASEN